MGTQGCPKPPAEYFRYASCSRSRALPVTGPLQSPESGRARLSLDCLFARFPAVAMLSTRLPRDPGAPAKLRRAFRSPQRLAIDQPSGEGEQRPDKIAADRSLWIAADSSRLLLLLPSNLDRSRFRTRPRCQSSPSSATIRESLGDPGRRAP